MSIVALIVVLVLALLWIGLVKTCPVWSPPADPAAIIQWLIIALIVAALSVWLLSAVGVSPVSCDHVRLR